MKCLQCKADNREGIKFCESCGAKLEVECPSCHAKIPLGKKFCGECGNDLSQSAPASFKADEPGHGTPSLFTAASLEDVTPIAGERKHVSVLFSDMSGYTAMSESLDPEEVKEITGRIFEEVAKIVTKYEGFIEKYIGDAILAIFGAHKAHEDDPIRAVKAAVDIHSCVDTIGKACQIKTGHFLAMHTGINTGLVVTGEINMEKGTHGLVGDTINLAARLSGLAESGAILVGSDTYAQTEGYFDFERLAPVAVKGKTRPVQAYRVIAQKEQPRKIHRLQGVRSRLIGRKVEMEQLQSAAEKLRNGSGSIFAIYGNAGTGKSRLIEEFKASLNLNHVQWIEGFAYPYTQNTPYYPLINLMSKAFQIKEGDSPETLKHKIETGITTLTGRDDDIIPYIGGLYSLRYPELDNVNPEFWKSQLQKATRMLLAAIARRSPTLICLEDLHWSDPSFLDLIRTILADIRDPIMFLCVYRPLITLFSSHQSKGMLHPYHEIALNDLSASDAQDMIESLLNSSKVPPELNRLVQEKIEGNPFYLEELVNSLMETGILAADSRGWHMTRTLSQTEISSTIHGVIAARLDRLKSETKRILQEASVIGRAFYFDILKRITELSGNLEQHLSGLERLDLIKARSIEPDLEYIFKHALTQEVVYNGLLIKERSRIHERIARVIEQLFADRLPEFYETLAFHYKQSNSLPEAVDYLIKAAEKSLKRYAVQESHAYFKDAYQLMLDHPVQLKDKRDLFFSLLNKWSLVYYYRGDFKEQTALLKSHEADAEAIPSIEIKAMFYGWLGWSLMFRSELKDSYRYLQKALTLGKEIKNRRIIGYARTWLTWLCAGMDRYEEAEVHWNKAVEIAKAIGSDQYLYFKSLGGIAQIAIFSGVKTHCHEVGNEILDYGIKHSNIRSQVVGHICLGHAHYTDGDIEKSLMCYAKALEIAVDPFYTEWARLYVGIAAFTLGDFDKGENALTQVASYIEKCGCETMSSAADVLLGAMRISKGEMAEGLQLIKNSYQKDLEMQWGYGIAISELALGNIYAQFAQAEDTPNFSILAKNIRFIVQHVPFAFKKSEQYFNKAIKSAKTYKALGLLGQAYYGLGNLYLAKNKQRQAVEWLTLAEALFERIEARSHLVNVRTMLKKIGGFA